MALAVHPPGRGPEPARPVRPDPDAPRGAPQLSDPGQHPLSGGRHPPGDPPVPAGGRRRRPALLPRPALAGLLAGEERKLGEALRHPDRRVHRRLRIHQPLDASGAAQRSLRVPRRHRRAAMQQAVLRFAVQRLGDEFRRPQRQRHPFAEPRRADGQLLPRHRRGQHQPLSPRERRRPGLGTGQRLLRVPHPRRQVRPRALRRPGPRPAGEDDRDQAQPGRQAGSRRYPAQAQGHPRDRRHPVACRWARIAFRRRATAPSPRRSN
ncbi:Uncharacterised protein [Pseudomonas aeruginosa]|nr:Uncharacterised protein [Pseudomonas aeruginosa]